MQTRARASLVLLRGVIWGIAGGFFGVVLLGALGHLGQDGEALWHLPAAAAVAGTVVGAFYAAKRVALLGGVAGAVASMTHLVALATPQGAWPVLASAAGLGLLAGALASQWYERKEGALFVGLAGLLAGFVAGLALALIASLTGGPGGIFALALVLAPTTGALFTGVVLRVGPAITVAVPQWLSVGLVAATVAGVVGVGMWLLAANLAEQLDPELQAEIEDMLGQLPQAFTGGLLGGATAGAVLELLRIPWMLPLTGGRRRP